MNVDLCFKEKERKVKTKGVRELSYSGAKEIDELSAGYNGILIAEFGLPGVGKSVAAQNTKWDFVDLNRTKIFGHYRVVILDTDNHLSEAEKNGEIEVTRERADRAWELTIAEYREIIVNASNLVIIVPDAGSDVEKRTEIYELAKENNFYIHSRYHRASHETAVEWNGNRLRKVDFHIMYRVYLSLETSWEEMHVQGHSFEIIDVKRVDFEAVIRKFSAEQLTRFLLENYSLIARAVDLAEEHQDVEKARRSWKKIRDLLSWKAPILQTYRTREGLENVMKSWAVLEVLQKRVWRTWKNMESRPSVLSAMAISEEAWGAIGKVSQRIDELRAAIPKAFEFAERASRLTDDSKLSLLQEIVAFRQIIDEAQKAALRAEIAQQEALRYLEDCKKPENASRREIPTDLDIFGASLEAGKASQKWEDLGCDAFLDTWKAVLNQQQEVIQTGMNSQIWNDSLWNRARIELYGVLKELELRF
jgi:tRNA uridine 5-carbamoylmethylation protein Kti12